MVMPSIRIYRARVDIGDNISGLVFSYDPINSTNTQIDGASLCISQVERFYVETPSGYELCVVNGRKLVRDPKEGENVYMRAARVVSRIWQNDPGFRIIPSTRYASLDQGEST
jgi:hypothetical protein